MELSETVLTSLRVVLKNSVPTKISKVSEKDDNGRELGLGFVKRKKLQ